MSPLLPVFRKAVVLLSTAVACALPLPVAPGCAAESPPVGAVGVASLPLHSGQTGRVPERSAGQCPSLVDPAADNDMLPAGPCQPVYPCTTRRAAEDRFNVVFVGVGFASVQQTRDAVRRVLNRNGLLAVRAATPGLMAIPVLWQNRGRFNFWYVARTRSFADPTDPAAVWSDLFREDWVRQCQAALPNRVIPVFLYPRMATAPYGSYGRSFALLADCPETGSAACSEAEERQYQQSNVHELLHTIPCLWDEYGAAGNADPQTARPFEGTLSGNGSRHLWAGDSYQACFRQAPWRDRIGDGCGQDGVIDCFACPLPVVFYNGLDMALQCCKPAKRCWQEIACFEGGVAADTGIWRPSSGSLLRDVYFPSYANGSNYLSPVHRDIIQAVIDKGPAIGRRWQGWFNYQLDCDIGQHEFAPDL